MREQDDPCVGCAHLAGATPSTPAIGRRHFLGTSAAVAVAALLAACSAGDATGPNLPPSGTVEIKVSDYPALATAGGVQILSSYRVAVVNTGADYLVLSLVCPHQGGAVTTAGAGFYCSRHGAEWTKNGQWVGGQPTTNLARIASRFDAGTGVLTIG